MEYREAGTRQAAGGKASGDDTARFLSELRQLRLGAGLGHAELAARAHFPYDSIMAAEVGPALPDLPVLSAYVRACGGTAEEWEERWRALTRSPSLPLSATRHAGRSDAATAGARIGSTSQAEDNPDASIIIAALNRVAEEMASPGIDGHGTEGHRAEEARAGAVPAASDIPPVGDTPLPDTAFPHDPRAADSAPNPLVSVSEASTATSEPVISDKPAGWDPIRVSTAWPAIRDTPAAAAGPASSTGSANGSGAGMPWGAAPWAEESLNGTSAATGGGGQAPSGAARESRAYAGSRTAATGDSGPGRSASWTRVVVVAAVLLCVLAVLLAVFA